MSRLWSAYWFEDGRPALQLLDLCDVQQKHRMFGLRTRIRYWLLYSLLEAGVGGFGCG